MYMPGLSLNQTKNFEKQAAAYYRMFAVFQLYIYLCLILTIAGVVVNLTPHFREISQIFQNFLEDWVL